MRIVTLLAAGALLLGGTTADAVPKRAMLSDGFTMSGSAGSQAVVRITKPFAVPYYSDVPRYEVTAGAGPIAGFAFIGLGKAKANRAFTVAGTPVWTCGAASCGNESGRQDQLSRLAAHGPHHYDLPPGDYVLVLLGARGAKVTATVFPMGKRTRLVRVTPTALGSALAVETTNVATGAGTDPFARGTFAAQAPGAGVAGLLHLTEMRMGSEYSSTLTAGRTNGTGCSGASGGMGFSRGRSVDPVYLTSAVLGPVAPGSSNVCGTWSGTNDAPLARQRGVGFYVSLLAK